jgi:hypothetical protein
LELRETHSFIPDSIHKNLAAIAIQGWNNRGVRVLLLRALETKHGAPAG